MRINLFSLKQRQEDWKEVENALYHNWIGNSTVILPRFCDYDFKKAFEQVKKTKTLKECQQILDLI